MILRNKNGIERNFRILFEVVHQNNKYIVYEDINTLNVYSGRVSKSLLKPLNNKEEEYINGILKGLVGSSL